MVAGGGSATPWATARQRLQSKEPGYWLSTVRPDGRPHTMPVLGVWLDDAFVFITGETTRKGRNLAHNGRCVLGVTSSGPPPLDLVIEGIATRVGDDETLHEVAEAYASQLDWQLTIRDGAVHGQNAPTAGPPPYAVYELAPTTAFGLPGVAGTDARGTGTEAPFTPTRWRFADPAA